MNIAVCVREILDPEMPFKAFNIDAEAKRAIKLPDVELVISDYDARALEAALQIKDSLESKVTVISLGAESAKNIIRRCIAMGADQGILISDPSFDDCDSFATASVLAEAIKKQGNFDLILCGIQEGDWDAGQVGSGIAELLDIPSVTRAANIKPKDGGVAVERVVADGRENVEISLPALVTVSSEIGEPRYPSIRRVREASKQEIPTWNAQDITPVMPRNELIRLSIPSRELECEFITGETPQEMGSNLALKLREYKAI
jgi:electron transfer flavoprotein beta subunit